MFKKLLIIYVFFPALVIAQGKTHNFLLGYTASALDSFTTAPKARLLADDTSLTVIGESRKMAFRATQANISDESGNLLISTNGCWIADATGDTMLNGNDLNPNSFTYDHCNNSNTFAALPVIQGNVLLPFPDNPNKYVLFHQTGNNGASLNSTEVYYSIIDLNLNNGLGAVTQKNVIVFSDTLSWGLAACKHANGRDWWIVAIRDYSTTIHKVLLDTSGVSYQGTQNLGFPLPYPGNGCQPRFSPDGKKFAYSTGRAGSFNPYHDVRLFNFDRCNGNFTSLEYITFNDTTTGFGLAFSSDSKYLYHSAYQKIYQLNTDTSNIQASLNTVAINDLFYSPYFPLTTNFWFMYLAANGKIYITSGSSVVDMHYINFPDSAGTACDVHLHDLHLPCYAFRGNVNHPNYYLGCDTTSGCPCLTTGLNELQQHDFKFSISPNPTNGNIKIIYLLPQNSKGVFEVYDVTGKKVFSNNLPPWSTLQNFDLRFLGDGIYNAVITSGNGRTGKKLAVIR